MKTLLTAAILGITGLTGVAGAEARDLRHDRHDRREVRHRRPVAPRIEWTWVAPRYQTVFAGYDHCGRPTYRTVCVSAGTWAPRACH